MKNMFVHCFDWLIGTYSNSVRAVAVCDLGRSYSLNVDGRPNGKKNTSFKIKISVNKAREAKAADFSLTLVSKKNIQLTVHSFDHPKPFI